VTAYPSWTPAPRPGIIPLQPLTFGTILGRSFSALRHNPKVLLGFAMVVQTVAYLVVTIAISGIAFASFSRLDTVPAGTDEWDAVLTGSITLTALSGLVLGLLAGAVGVLVQAVVISDVLHAAVAEKMTLRMLWQRVRPVAWRLIGYTILLSLAIGVIVIIVGGLIAVLAVAVPAAAVILGILVILAAIPLSLWLAVKLLLVPAVLIVEHTSLGAALGRSWRLSRGRFWVILGILVLVSLVFGAVAQVVSIPFSFLASALTTVIAPTGDESAAAIIGIVATLGLTQIVTLLIQSVAVIVQSTAAGLVYIDCRMRHEGLDLDLLEYVDRRDAGNTDLPDPYVVHVGRAAQPRWPTAYGQPAPFAPPPGYTIVPPPAAEQTSASPAAVPPAPDQSPPAPTAGPDDDQTTWAMPR
jgi:membrane-anchored glycerophosphoryl diester phosphodiesterase (GDPDase)|tara:strand:- start:565 stop:1800 length:1236 start_codon:yes stop_codon:yes gene_type:complete